MSFSKEAVEKRSAKAKKELDDAAAAKKKALKEEQEQHIGAAISLVAGQNFADATSIINDLLSQRVVLALDEYKQSVAKNLFAPSVELSEEKEDDKEDGDEKDGEKEEDEDEKEEEKEEKDDKEDKKEDKEDEKK